MSVYPFYLVAFDFSVEESGTRGTINPLTINLRVLYDANRFAHHHYEGYRAETINLLSLNFAN